MSDLFLNKVAGSALAAGLALFGLNELSHVLYHPHELEEDAYVIEVADSGGEGPAVEVKGPVDFATLISAADPAIGERVAKKCVSCHSFEKGGADMTGPHLYGVLGRAAASVSGFNYSNAMKEYAKPWGYQNMYDYLENPRGYVPGTAMAFAGLKKQDERIAVLAYLRQQSDTPPALPAPIAAAAPAEPEAPVELVSPADAVTPDAAPVEPSEGEADGG